MPVKGQPRYKTDTVWGASPFLALFGQRLQNTEGSGNKICHRADIKKIHLPCPFDAVWNCDPFAVAQCLFNRNPRIHLDLGGYKRQQGLTDLILTKGLNAPTDCRILFFLSLLAACRGESTSF